MGLIIFGTGEISEVMHYYFTEAGSRKVDAFTVSSDFMRESTHLGLPVVPFEDVWKDFPPTKHEMFVAMSFKRLNNPRAAVCLQAKAMGYKLASFVHPQAMVWRGFDLRPNTFIMENNVIQPYVKIGEDTTLWSGNHIGHHTTIGDHVFIASHAVISGHVKIGDNTFVGVNATIRDNVTIGRRCIIGAGALVLHDVPDDSVVRGLESYPRSRFAKA